MKFKIYYLLFTLFGVLGCVFAYFQMPVRAIFFRSFCLLTLTLVYYKCNRYNNIFFYLGILVSGFGEALLVLGFETFPTLVILCFIIYAWVLILMVKSNNINISYRIEKSKLVPLFISAGLVLYLLLSILALITPNLGDSIYYGYFFIFSFFVMAIYMSFNYMEEDSIRYIWLLLFMFIVVISIAITSLEAFYFSSELFSQIGYITQIVSHFFLLKFFITKDNEIKF